MQVLRKDRRWLRSKISPLLPRDDYKNLACISVIIKISHVYQLSDMRVCAKISIPRMSSHAGFWVASSGFRRGLYQPAPRPPSPRTQVLYAIPPELPGLV